MQIDVYDTYARSAKGQVIHFDVLVEKGAGADVAFKYAQDWLKEIGENPAGLEQSRCNFCHSENAHPVVEKSVRKKGHFILQMEGCPNPI